MEKVNIFAIDLGNKKIKMKSDRAEYSYPASYLTTDFLSEDSLSAHQQIKENQVYSLDDNSNAEFIWGSAMDMYNLPEKMIDTYARSKRINQKKMQRLIKFALGRLALDYMEELSDDTPLEIHVMLGAPITDMHKNSDTIFLLKKLLIGQHHIRVNNQDVWIVIPSEEHISIIPQYMGTLLDLSFDQKFNNNVTYLEGELGIIDIGGGTILVNTSNALNLSPIGMEKFYGTQYLFKKIASEINSTKLFLIEKLLREGDKEKGYFYKTNRNGKNTRDVTDIVTQAIDNYTRFIIAPLITENFPDLESFDFIVMTGGGSLVVSKTALLDEIGEDYFERLVFTEEPELSNVRGFYKGAVIKWRDDYSELNLSGQSTQNKSNITGKWGTASVEFEEETGTLKVYEGQLSTELFPKTINRSEIKAINFEGPVSFPVNSHALFGSENYQSDQGAMVSLEFIKGAVNISTSQVEDMSFMFNGCHALKEVDFTYFDTTKVINFSNMFANCYNIKEVNLSSFDSSKVINLDSMFLNCTSLEYLNLDSFIVGENVSKINTFEGCTVLRELNAPSNMLV